MPTITPNEGIFINPKNKPLSTLTFEISDQNGEMRNVAALNKYWTTHEVFTNYLSLITPRGTVKVGAELEEWMQVAQDFRDDMEHLLSRRHHEFWSYLVYQKAVLTAITSFLQHATPFYLNDMGQDDKVTILYEEILNLVLRIICRITTSKESNGAWLTEQHMRDIIYSNYIITAPMLFDLVVAVGNAEPNNQAFLQNLFDSLLTIEPQYKSDLEAGLNHFQDAFRNIQRHIENESCDGATGGAIQESSETPFDDISIYTLDCAYTLQVLLDVCPDLCLYCDSIKFGPIIANFYDSTLPLLYKRVYLYNNQTHILNWLNQARLQFLRAFRSIAHYHIQSALENPKQSLSFSEHFIALLTECLSEQTFVIDYQRQYPVELDIDIFKQSCKGMDDFKTAFLIGGYRKEAESEILHKSADSIFNESKLNSHDVQRPQSAIEGNDLAKRHRDLDVEMTAVMDMFPLLEIGFVRSVLLRYENSEDAISAILENNLPPDLTTETESSPNTPPEPQNEYLGHTSTNRFNIYDGDPYDFMSHDNPHCIIKQGKGFPNVPKTAEELLDDKQDVKALKDRYQQYSLVDDSKEENEADEYDDEYDDSYEAIVETESRLVKNKTLKANIVNDNKDSESDGESDNSSEEGELGSAAARGMSKKPLEFCENPEIVRARYEARMQSKWNRKPPAAANAPSVVGAPKGQGQDKQTLRNRNKKEVNKSTRANHNRKAGAAFKRSKGMIS